MYHVGRNGQQTGPFSIEQLKTMAANGELQPTDLVWKEGMAGWEPASTLPGVFTTAPAPAPGAVEMPQASPAPLAEATVLPPAAGPGGPKPNPLALTGMILGIVSIVLVCCCYGFPFNVAGIVCSVMGMNQIKASGGTQAGMGMAQTGLWCSIASILIGILLAIFGAAMNWQQWAEGMNKS